MTFPNEAANGPSIEWLRAQVDRGEARDCEFKRQWYDLDRGPQKAEFIKDILALCKHRHARNPVFFDRWC